MRRFFAPPENFQNNEIILSLEESRHLRDVLRLREGENVYVFDGEGKEFSCQIKETGSRKDSSKLEIIAEISPFVAESRLNLSLAIALLKGEKFDLVVQKATELGVCRIVPLETKRADVKIELNPASKKIERWQKIALEAAKQCGRAVVPKISEPVKFENFVKQLSGNETGILFAERSGHSLNGINLQNSEKLTAIVGAEGGWEDAEIDLARENNWQIITLGGRILRAETAGIVVTALLQHLYGDLY